MSSLPSLCHDIQCNLSANVLWLLYSMIYIVVLVRNYCVTEPDFLCNINCYPLPGRMQWACSEILYDFIFTDTGEQIMRNPSRPACYRKVWTLWLCNNCLAWLAQYTTNFTILRSSCSRKFATISWPAEQSISTLLAVIISKTGYSLCWLFSSSWDILGCIW